MGKVNDNVVHEMINAAWAHYNDIPDPAQRAHVIYLELYKQRNSGDPALTGSVDVAAAEHYYYARQLVSYEHYPVEEAKLLVVGYHAFKGVRHAIASSPLTQSYAPEWFQDWIDKVGRHDPSKPMMLPSKELKNWGLLGCDAGAADLKVMGKTARAKWKAPPKYAGTRAG